MIEYTEFKGTHKEYHSATLSLHRTPLRIPPCMYM